MSSVPVLQSGDNWTCKLDGAEGHQPFPSNQLHALEMLPADQELHHFDATCLEEALPLSEIDSWMHAYTHNPERPVDLHRKRPDANLWHTVLSGQRSIDSLSEYDVLGLRYLASGGTAYKQQSGAGTGQVEPTRTQLPRSDFATEYYSKSMPPSY